MKGRGRRADAEAESGIATRRAGQRPSQATKLASSCRSGAVALFRMELRREDISPCNRASKRRRIIGGADRHRGVLGLWVIAVREVEAGAIRNAGPERMGPRLTHGAPSHVRHLEALPVRQHHRVVAKAHDAAGQEAQARQWALPRSCRTASAGRGRCRGTVGFARPRSRHRAARSRRGSGCNRASRSGRAARRARRRG